MTGQTSPTPDFASRAAAANLSSLEMLGAFFTSQIHDFNNQMAVLSNAELLLPTDTSLSPAMADFMKRLFGAIHRLSGTCDQFNAVRKLFPIDLPAIGLLDAFDAVAEAAGRCPGWKMTGRASGTEAVLLQPAWLPFIIETLIADLGTAEGSLNCAVGELPLRQYEYALRPSFLDHGPSRALLIRLKGEPVSPAGSKMDLERPAHFKIALELIRLQGAGISLTISDSAQDYLLAFRLKP